jgi:hypothetical protein
MANVDPKDHDHRALLIPDDGVLGVVMSATTQAGPKVGGASMTSGSGSMSLTTSGTVDAAFTDVNVRTLEAGVAGTATTRWKYSSGADYHSWDPPIAVAGAEIIDRTTTADYYGRPHAVRMPDTGRIMAVVSSTSGLDTVTVWLQGTTGLWSSVTVATPGNSTAACLVPIPRGTGWRYLCFYTYQNSSTNTQIRMSYSDDNGATWTVGSTSCLSTALTQASSAYPRLRAVYLNGAISLIVWRNLTSDYLAQYVSTDGGGTLTLVETFSSSLRGYPDMAVYGGTIYVGFLYYLSTRTDADITPYVCRLSSASQPISSVLASAVAVQTDSGVGTYVSEWGTQAANLLTAGDFAMVVDDDGLIWCYGVDWDSVASTRESIVRVSLDLGETWNDPYISSHVPVGVCWWPGGDTSTFPDQLCAVLERGRVVMIHTATANPINDHASLFATYLGGWSTRGMDEDATYGDLRRYLGVSGWDYCYLPIDTPDATGATWTPTITGAAAASIGNKGLVLDAPIGDAISYSATPTMAGAFDEDGIIAEFHVEADSGTWAHDVRICDGAAAFMVRVSVTSADIVIRDMYAGADLTTIALAGTSGVAIRIALDTTSYAGNNGRVTVMYRQDGPYTGGTPNFGPRASRIWSSNSYTGLTAGVSVTANVTFGCAAGLGSATYKMVAFSDGQYTAGNGAAVGSIVTRGRIVPSSIRPLHLAEGARIQSGGGYSYSGDTWTIPTAYDYPVTNLDPSRKPSPRSTWRATGTGVNDITWTCDLGFRAGDLVGMMLVNANFRTATLYQDAGLVKVMDMDLGISGLGFVRSRDQIIPAAGANLNFFAHEGALVGATVDLGGGDLRKVRHNHAGAWLATGGAGTYPSTRVLLDTYDAADAASGTLTLRMPSGLFITNLLTSTNLLTLRIDNQSTAEGYHELGTVLLGRVHILRQYGRGRVVAFSPSTELVTTESGSRFARRLGPGRRKVEFTYDDSIDMSQVSGTATTAPDYYSLGYAGADALVAPAATPYTVGGLIQLVGGSRVPIGYIPALKQPSSTPTTTAPYSERNPHAFLYGRALVEEWRTDAQLGSENASELVRGGLVTIEEEV